MAPNIKYRLKAPLIQGGVERKAGEIVSLRPDQAERLVEFIEPAEPVKRRTRTKEIGRG